MPTRAPSQNFNQKLALILKHATRVFYEKGYEGASIRDISRRTGVSLAGLYYYFESKEKLLYLIQKHCFNDILQELGRRLAGVNDPERKLRLLISNHLHFFLRNYQAMKVLSHEAESLTEDYQREITDIKRSYYKTCVGILEELKQRRRLRRLNTRLAALSLYGMMNWIYTWYNPRMDPDAEALAEAMATIFLRGVLELEGARATEPARRSVRAVARAHPAAARL